MLRLKSADNPNGFMISLIVNQTDYAWLLGGDRLKKAYFRELADQAMKIKQEEILRGIDRHGKRFIRLSKRTIENRRSAMVRHADPYAPVFVPGHESSRTYAYLRYEIRNSGVWFFWRHDPRTGGSWGDILRHHATGAATGKVRDSFGISPSGMAKLEHMMEQWYAQNKSKYLSRIDKIINVAIGGRRLTTRVTHNLDILSRVLSAKNTNPQSTTRDPLRTTSTRFERVNVTPEHIVSATGRPTTLRGYRQKRIVK
jgi:hypothetical protein